MRIAIEGNTWPADRLRALVQATDGFTLATSRPAFTIQVGRTTDDRVHVDTPDGPFEQHLFRLLRAAVRRNGNLAGVGLLALDAEGGNQNPKVMSIALPDDFEDTQLEAITRALWIALCTVAQHGDTRPWWERRWPWLFALALLLASPAAGQTNRVTFGGVAQPVTLADNADRLLGAVSFIAPQHIICDSGCSSSGGGGTVDQGTAAMAAGAWPFYVTFGGAAIDPRLVTVQNASLAVTGTFWQATQPISAASLPLPTGASTESTLATLNGKVTTASALPGLADTGTVVRVIPEERVSTGALDHLGAVVSLSVKGFQSWGGSIDAGTCTCTIVAESSNDDGATYVSALVFSDIQQVTQWVMSSPNASVTAEFLPTGKTTNAQLRVSAYTSGAATARLRAAAAQTATGVGALSSGIPTLPAPFFRTLIGGADGSGNAQGATVISSAPGGSEQALVTRNIPSGTQTISGTVTADAGTNLNTSALALDATVAKDATLTTIDTDVKANITLHAGSNVIGHVVADSGSTTAVTGNVATTIADGADTTLGAKADAKSIATDTTAVTAMSVLKEISAMEQAPASRAVTNAGTFAVQAAATIADGADSTQGAKADAKNTATDTTAISAMSVLKEISAMEQAPASRAVTNAGTFAVQAAATIADGADATQGAKADAKSAATDTTAVSAMSVLKEISSMEQAPASRAVTNAGTFAVQATLQAGAAIAGKVGIDQTTPGTTNGVQVNAALPAGANVIGHVIADSGSTTAVTGSVATTAADASNVTLGAKADAKSTATDTTAVTAMSVLKEISAMEQAPASRAVTNAGTFAVQAAIADAADVTLGAKADAKSTATDTTSVTAMSVLKEISAMEQAPASRAVTNAGTFAVQAAIADGASVTLGAKADAKSTATDTTSVTVMSVLKEISAMEQAPASRAVTNAGTFAVQDTPPTLTKGSQGSTGYSVQNLYDAGRSRVSFTADRVTPAASDTLVTFVKNVAGTATSAQTTYTVTAAKTFRVTSIYVGIANTSTVSANVRVALRENTGGTCTASSAAVAMLQVAAGNIAANEGADGSLAIPDGWEFPAADSVCISAIGVATTETLTVTVLGYEY